MSSCEVADVRHGVAEQALVEVGHGTPQGRRVLGDQVEELRADGCDDVEEFVGVEVGQDGELRAVWQGSEVERRSVGGCCDR